MAEALPAISVSTVNVIEHDVQLSKAQIKQILMDWLLTRGSYSSPVHTIKTSCSITVSGNDVTASVKALEDLSALPTAA